MHQQVRQSQQVHLLHKVLQQVQVSQQVPQRPKVHQQVRQSQQVHLLHKVLRQAPANPQARLPQ